MSKAHPPPLIARPGGAATTVDQCKNCDLTVNGMFCSRCGQSVRVTRISASYVLGEIFDFITNIRICFLFTSLRLLASPGAVAVEFIDGKRRKYQSPVSYFLIWTTIYILLLSIEEVLPGHSRIIDYGEYFGPGKTTTYAISHLAVVLTAVIPLQSIYLYVLITNQKFTYFETVASVIYLIGTILLLQSVFVLLVWVMHFVGGIAAVNLAVSDALKVLYVTWFAADLSKKFLLRMKALRVAIFVGLASGTFSVWRLYGVPILLQTLHFGSG